MKFHKPLLKNSSVEIKSVNNSGLLVILTTSGLRAITPAILINVLANTAKGLILSSFLTKDIKEFAIVAKLLTNLSKFLKRKPKSPI